MEAALFYLGKMILTSGLMFGYYQLFLKDKTFHHYNRFYLLITLLASLLLPLLKISYFTLEVNSDIYLLINKLQPASQEVNNNDTIAYSGIFGLGLVLVSVVLMARFIYGSFKILKLRKRFPQEGFKGINFYRTDLDNAPFSYFKNLFWKNAIPINSVAGAQILKHEMAHIEQKHSYDKVLIEIIRSVFWFNPFFYLIKKEMHLIHEYLADKKAIKQSDTKAFAQMLLVSHFAGNTLPAASPFLNTHLKKRLKMLKTSQTKFSYARKAFALPLFCSIAFACVVHAQNTQIKVTNNEITQAVNEIEQDTTITESVITTEREARGTHRSEHVKKATRSLEQNNAKLSRLDMEIQEQVEALKTIDPDDKAFSLKIKEINALGKKMSELVNSEDFKTQVVAIKKQAIDYSAVLSKEDLKYIKEARAVLQEEARMAVQEAASMRKEAASAREEAEQMKAEAISARKAAEIARKEAALAREEAERMREQHKNR